jgi:membrane protease YdiL (CAAX protease family)
MLAGVVLTAVLAVVILGLLAVLGERLRDLQLQPGRLWGDLWSGVVLAVALLAGVWAVNGVLVAVLGPLYSSELPESNRAIGRALLADPLLLAIFLGPVVWLQAALVEELTRVFALSRLWKVWPGETGRTVSVVVYSLFFGLAHLYQGPLGVLQTGVIGLILGWHYLRRGRVVPLVVAHGLYDTAATFSIITIVGNERFSGPLQALDSAAAHALRLIAKL